MIVRIISVGQEYLDGSQLCLTVMSLSYVSQLCLSDYSESKQMPSVFASKYNIGEFASSYLEEVRHNILVTS